MTSSAVFKPGVGIILTINGKSEGMSVIIPDTMLVSAVEKHVAELVDWLS
jgi:hypothetical protein